VPASTRGVALALSSVGQLDGGKAVLRRLEQRNCTVAILQSTNGSRARPPVSTRACRLRPLIFLPGHSQAGRRIRGLRALAIDYGSTGTGFAADPRAVQHDRPRIDRPPNARVPPSGEQAIDSLPGREQRGSVRHGTPPRGIQQHIEDVIDDGPHWPGRWSPNSRKWRQQGFQDSPFRCPSGHWRSGASPHMLRAGGCGPLG
jgi:hypothetical protein